MPVFDHHYGRPDCWPGLSIEGLVKRPQIYTAAGLAALTDAGADAAITADFRCVEGWTAPGQHWEGVPLRRLLDAAGTLPSARYAAISAADYTVAVPLYCAARDGDDADTALLATRLNGAPLRSSTAAPAVWCAGGRSATPASNGLTASGLPPTRRMLLRIELRWPGIAPIRAGHQNFYPSRPSPLSMP